MQERQIQDNKMGVMPVGRLLMSMSLPIMVSMLIQALYNIVDSMFVARISEDALTAVSLAFPIQNLMIAVATGTGVGMNALLSKALGAKDFDRANRAATNGLFVLVLSCVPFMLFGGLLTDWFMRTQTDIESIILHGDSYLRVVCLVSVGAFGAIAVERLLQATGKTVYSMITQAVGAVINIVLDPVLIFGLGGLPAMGVTGAAVATVLSQCVSFVLGIVFNIFCNREISLSYRSDPDGVHRLGDDVLHEPDPDRVHLDGDSGAGRVLQAAVLHLHAHIRPEQRSGTHRVLQLRREKEKTHGAQHQACDPDGGVHHGGGVPCL